MSIAALTKAGNSVDNSPIELLTIHVYFNISTTKQWIEHLGCIDIDTML